MGFFGAVREEAGNFFKMVNPATAGDFFSLMEIKPKGYTLRYLFGSGIFFFIGYLLNSLYKPGHADPATCSLEASVEAAFLSFFAVWLLPYLVGTIIQLTGKGLLGKRASADEIVAVISYPLSVVMVSGLFKAHYITLVLHLIGIAYGLYLLYVAIEARFGFERALLTFIFFLIVCLIVFMLVFWFLLTLINLVAGIFTSFLGFHPLDSPIRFVDRWCYEL